jgi:hypothetical protein
MRSDAFALVEAELLHTLGVLVVSAYEQSYEATRKATYLSPTDTIDMFQVSPPPRFIAGTDCLGDDPFTVPSRRIHTIVPGQIKDTARERNIVPFIVYGSGWATSSGLTEEEEKAVEESYYFQSFVSVSEIFETESQGDEMNEDDSDSHSSFSDHNLGPFCSNCGEMEENIIFDISACGNAYLCSAACQKEWEDSFDSKAELEAKDNGSSETNNGTEDESG